MTAKVDHQANEKHKLQKESYHRAVFQTVNTGKDISSTEHQQNVNKFLDWEMRKDSICHGVPTDVNTCLPKLENTHKSNKTCRRCSSRQRLWEWGQLVLANLYWRAYIILPGSDETRIVIYIFWLRGLTNKYYINKYCSSILKSDIVTATVIIIICVVVVVDLANTIDQRHLYYRSVLYFDIVITIVFVDLIPNPTSSSAPAKKLYSPAIIRDAIPN